MRKLILTVITIFFSLLVVIIFVKTKNENGLVFFYPKLGNNELGRETRFIKNEKKNFEKKLIEEFLLGPVENKLYLNIPEELKVIEVFTVIGKKSVDLVVNFNSKFSEMVEEKSAEPEVFLKSFIETIKANTRVKKILFLSEGYRINKKVGEYYLGNFIDIRTKSSNLRK
jgi:hypothetical protein